MFYLLKNQIVRNSNFNAKRKDDGKQKNDEMKLWYNKARPRTNALNLMLENLDPKIGRASCRERV